MRWPRIGNVLRKTWNRLYWYFREVVPLFVFASVILWLLDLKSAALYGTLANGDPSSALKWIEGVLAPCMSLLDLPREAAESFLIGFFRRDFGAVGLFKLSSEDVLVEGVARALTDRQMLVASFTMTLFVPCVASFMMMWKERGGRTAWITFGLVTMLAIAAGAGLNVLLLALGWK